MSSTDGTQRMPLAEARALVRHLAAPNPLIYWLDFSICIALGWGAFVLALQFAFPSVWQAPCILVAALSLYRAVLFTHELAHLRRDTFGRFRLFWNVTCGMPLMVPSFTYRGVHSDHHKQGLYGTKTDGEYLAFGAGRPYKIVAYMLLIFVLPLLLAFRFIVLTPLTYLHGSLRHLLWERLSSLAIDLSYRRPEVSSRDDSTWRLQELFTCLYGATAILLVVTGWLSFDVLILWYATAVVIFLLNSLRTLAAHRYLNPGDRVMNVWEQYLDSVNVPGNRLLTALWAPVGLRYHATHHLLPDIPYHSLGRAHRRLAEELSDSPAYLQASRRNLWDALRTLWNDARGSRAAPGAPALLH